MPSTTKTSRDASRPGGIDPALRRTTTWVWPGAVVVGILVLVLAGFYTGVTAVQQLADPGAITRWGLPLTKTVHNITWSITVGALVFAAGILPRWSAGRSRKGASKKNSAGTLDDEHPAYRRTLTVAAAAGAVWTLAALGQAVFTYSDLAGMPLNSSAGFTSGLVDYVQSISVGQAWFWMTVIAAVVTSLVFALRSPTALGFTAVLALMGVVPMALIGHSASGDDHTAAVNSIGLHLLGVLLWMGGLVLLMLLVPVLTGKVRAAERGSADQQRPLVQVTLQRYSALAGLALFTVAISGVVNATVRMEHLEQLLSPYGVLVMAKFVGTVLLGFIGLAHRQWLIPRLGDPGSPVNRLLWRLIAVEILVMTAVMSVATILGRTAPPKPEEEPPNASPARLLTGYDMPPELTAARWVDTWRLDWLWVAIIVFLALWYVRSAVRLRRRGDRWPVLRSISWLIGLVVLHWTTSGAPAVYSNVLFSAHMVAHMTLTMIAPLFLVLGAPITLALRSLTARKDGTRGPREWMLALLHSGWGRFVTHPIFVGMNFAGSLLLFYYTPIFGFALDAHVGHELMNVHFLITGILFATVMIGIDPLPHRPMYPLRLVLLLATMMFHAFIGVAIMGSESLLEAAWFSSLGRDWGVSAIEDQQLGGAFMWGIGEFPTVVMAVITVWQWWRHDKKTEKNEDRRADASGNQELAEWNDMFARLAAQDAAHDDAARRGGTPDSPSGGTPR